MAECELVGVDFTNANLRQASLWRAECKNAVFVGANLEEADLDYANLDGCTFKDALVRKAVFPFARLSREEVHQSVRTGARVRMTRPYRAGD